MSIGLIEGGEGAGGGAELRIDHLRSSPNRTRLTARLGDAIVHQDVIDVASAAARGRFAGDVAARTGLDPMLIRDQLLAEAVELEELYDEGGEGGDREAARRECRLVADHEDPERRGLYLVTRGGPEQLTNFVLQVVEDVTVVDDIQSSRSFRCRAVLAGTTSEFTIAAEDFANNARLPEAIFAAAGPKAQIFCKPYLLRTAISAVSDPECRALTSNFGWTEAGDAYQVPSGRIDASGFHRAGPDDPIRVDLGGEQCARHLDLREPEPGEVARLKRHLVDDFLALHDRPVMNCLVAAVALAVLFRFAPGMNRFALWLVGLTGGGKSFVAKLAMNFFGDFPIQDGTRVGSWSSTANFLQRQGYFFKDALYLIDDYKKEVTRHHEVVKIAQNYADGSARGRLNADATTNVSREIRGQFVSTGEDVPEHSASALARSIVVPVPSRAKDVARGRRCLEHRASYAGLMADFIRHLIAGGRTAGFAARVARHQEFFYRDIVGRQNDLRIAGNFALLAAAFEEVAGYLGEASPRSRAAVSGFIERDLIGIRDEMLGMASEQQASTIFLTNLEMLVANGHVRITGYQPPGLVSTDLERRPVIGRRIDRRRGGPPEVFEIATELALEAVQSSLQKQGRPPLPASHKALIDQLAAEGLLLDRQNRPIDPDAGGNRTWGARIGPTPRKSFRIAAGVLMGEPGPGGEDDRGVQGA